MLKNSVDLTPIFLYQFLFSIFLRTIPFLTSIVYYTRNIGTRFLYFIYPNISKKAVL